MSAHCPVIRYSFDQKDQIFLLKPCINQHPLLVTVNHLALQLLFGTLTLVELIAYKRSVPQFSSQHKTPSIVWLLLSSSLDLKWVARQEMSFMGLGPQDSISNMVLRWNRDQKLKLHDI